MPTCALCSTPFPNRMFIEGKVRNLRSRKYCPTCSPFGSRNTRRLEPGDRIGAECKCKRCGRGYVYDKSKGHSWSRCNSCIVNSRRPLRKRQAIQYKGGACRKCGYDRCDRSLCFHHLDPEDKGYTISQGAYMKSWDVLKLELDKCVLLCMNCHGEVHEGLVDSGLLAQLV